MNPKTIGLALVLAVSPAMGEMYEWRDPTTGRLKLGDTPPVGVQFWKEGERKPGEVSAKQTISPRDMGAYSKMPPKESRRATEEEIAECVKLIKIASRFKDPDSVKIEGAAFFSVWDDGSKRIMMELNAKNSYGAYAGSKPAFCVYKPDGDLKEAFVF